MQKKCDEIIFLCEHAHWAVSVLIVSKYPTEQTIGKYTFRAFDVWCCFMPRINGIVASKNQPTPTVLLFLIVIGYWIPQPHGIELHCVYGSQNRAVRHRTWWCVYECECFGMRQSDSTAQNDTMQTTRNV